ncbi:MAG: PAS domain S-box protein [Candidatus Marinimicrobia bacterium]|nr:PAS domain S-box protein [Candidatus Neomarinimicrobiota bacterium]
MNLELIKNWLLETNIPKTSIAKNSGVTRKTLYNIIDGKNIREKSLRKIKRVYEESITKSDDTNLATLIETQQSLIKYMDHRIEVLEEKVISLKNSPAQTDGMNEISDMPDNIINQWDWVFYGTDKPMSCSREGVLRNVNPALCKHLGYSEDEMVGKSILEFIHPDEHEKAIIEMKKHKRNVELRLLKSNGIYCRMHIKADSFGPDDNPYSIGLLTPIENV